MATHHGKNGVVKVGANTVAEVTEFTVVTRVEVADDTAMGDSWRTHKADIPSWNGTLTCWWDETDTNGQEALSAGASVTLNLYPEGAGAGATFLGGTATITEVTITTQRAGIVTRSFAFEGNGELLKQTV